MDLLAWAVPALLIVPVFYLLSPKGGTQGATANKAGVLWWPDFKNPLVWLLGLTFGSNNSPFFGTNAFLGDYLASGGKADLLGPALGWLNGAQIVAPFILLLLADRLQRRAWPFLLFGPVLMAAFLGLIFGHSTFVILLVRGFGRIHHRHYAYGHPRSAACAMRRGRFAAYIRRHVHYQLYDGDYHPDHQRGTLGRHWQTMDGIRAAVSLRRRTDDIRHRGFTLSTCNRKFRGLLMGTWYRSRPKGIVRQ